MGVYGAAEFVQPLGGMKKKMKKKKTTLLASKKIKSRRECVAFHVVRGAIRGSADGMKQNESFSMNCPCWGFIDCDRYS